MNGNGRGNGNGNGNGKSDSLEKVTVVVLARHIAALDRLAVDIRLEHGRAISRTDIVRGFVEAALQSRVDLSAARCGEEVASLMGKNWPG